MLAAEIKGLQGELSDLNLMNEQIDKKVEVAEVLAEKDELKRRNDDESREMDDMFAARSKLDADTKKVEDSIAEVKSRREAIVQGMEPNQAAAYAEMTSENERWVAVLAARSIVHSFRCVLCRYMAEIESHEAELARLNTQAAQMEAELQQVPMKRDAMRLYDQIAQMEAKRDQIKTEMAVGLAEFTVTTPNSHRILLGRLRRNSHRKNKDNACWTRSRMTTKKLLGWKTR